MLRYDRSRHVYIIGQTGAGKSGLLELFALSDISIIRAMSIIDPHGDFAINNMKFIPPAGLKMWFILIQPTRLIQSVLIL